MRFRIYVYGVSYNKLVVYFKRDSRAFQHSVCSSPRSSCRSLYPSENIRNSDFNTEKYTSKYKMVGM